MKTLNEYLLSCLAEEAAEIIQAIMKAERFGLNDVYPKRGIDNRENIAMELDDLLAVVELLRERSVVRASRAEGIAAKKVRVFSWAEYSRDIGTLELPPVK